jgi:hypothetical protein
MTNQKTFQIYTTPSLKSGAKWSVFANISHAAVAKNTHPEDPFMWVDTRGNWHIINHAYDTTQKVNCGSSVVSTHFYSVDGKDWSLRTGVEPYSHTVEYDDGTKHTFVPPPSLSLFPPPPPLLCRAHFQPPPFFPCVSSLVAGLLPGAFARFCSRCITLEHAPNPNPRLLHALGTPHWSMPPTLTLTCCTH